MSNYLTVKKELITYLNARTPVIILKSSERERCENLLQEVSKEIHHEIFAYSNARNVYKISSLQTIEKASLPASYIMDFFKKKREETFALVDATYLSNDNAFSQDVLNAIYCAKESNSTLIIITGDNVWNRINSLGLIVNLSLPNEEEIFELLSKFINTYKKQYKINYNEEDIIFASAVLKGFSQAQIINILSSSLVKDNGLFKENIALLGSQKKKIYDSLSNVELIELDNKIDLIGLENFKLSIENKKKIFFSKKELLTKYDLSYPKGFLLTGIPGCGKSLSAKYIAQVWNLPLFKFNIDTIFDKWVGESEKRMQEALSYIDHMAPCILWVDEIEKALATSDSGHETGKRIIGQFLFWLQESKSRVFLVATANNVNQLPSELFRKGRFSEIFFIDLPSLVERKQSIINFVNKSLHLSLLDEQINELSVLSKGFSYADIESAVKSTAEKMIIEEDYQANYQDLLEMFKSTISYQMTNPEIVEQYQLWGSLRAKLASVKGE